MHAIHVTEGIVLGKRGVGESNSLVYVLTQELGLVRASARSTRIEASKLRYGLESLTHARFSFVKGKHEWRLVQVERAKNIFKDLPVKNRVTAGRVAQLLLRLVRGQEPQPLLYTDIAEGFIALASTEHLDAVETVLVLRVLSHLGYLPYTEALAPFVEGGFSIDLAAKAFESRSLLVRTINESLQASGL